jgi:hypothetical protein
MEQFLTVEADFTKILATYIMYIASIVQRPWPKRSKIPPGPSFPPQLEPSNPSG